MDLSRLKGFEPERILLCQLRQIGDVVLLTPAIGMLKARYPKASIHVYTEKKCAPVLENNPDVAGVFEVDKSLGLWDSLAFYKRVGRAGFDLIIDFQQLPRCRWMLMFSKAKVKLTFEPPWYNRWLYTHWAPHGGPYAAQCKAGVLSALGLEWQGQRPRMYLSGAEAAWADKYLAERGLGPGEVLVTVDPTHRRPTRRWPATHFARVLDLAVEAEPRLRFLLLYGPGERDTAERVLSASARPGRMILPQEVVGLRQMAALIQRAGLQFGNCSAPRHFAVALDTPSLTVRGATSDAWTYPGPNHEDVSLGLDCQPCNLNACPLGDPPPCLADLGPEAVLPRLLAMLPQG
ncbi:MAG: glycosyltransferase family 9 protein [Desulfovibrionaceae bacterium]|nr:glycosyltransferase family 9 protein [Desulfovibrionaceae bacterium]